MDILNWLYLAKNKFIKTTVQDNDLLVVGTNVGFSKRGDKYQNYGVTAVDFASYINSFGGSVATNGTSLYSTSPATSNFNTQNGVYLGANAGNGTNDQKNVMIGYYAGNGATGVYNANFIGVSAGEGATGASKSVFIGHRAGELAVDSYRSVFLGRYAGASATQCNNSNFLGQNSGAGADNAYQSNFIGNGAGASTINAYNCNFFGVGAGASSRGHDVNAFGINAGIANELDGQTIFSNASMPTFADHTAAATAITVLNGASANSTYLYHNQATNSIGAVRL